MPLIILDRDGVINTENNAYIKSPAEWEAIPGSLNAISLLNKAGFTVAVATNQSGISRKIFDERALNQIHAKLTAELALAGGTIAEILFCPHQPADNCLCRKPQPGMLLALKAKYPADFTQTFYVGDSLTDIKAAYNAGCKPMLVLTGNGQTTLAQLPNHHQVPYFANLATAAEFIISAPS